MRLGQFFCAKAVLYLAFDTLQLSNTTSVKMITAIFNNGPDIVIDHLLSNEAYFLEIIYQNESIHTVSSHNSCLPLYERVKYEYLPYTFELLRMI